MKLYSHCIPTLFDVNNAPQPMFRNDAIELWWKERRDWLAMFGKGMWSAYRVPQAFLVIQDCADSLPGSHRNSGETVIWTFDDPGTAALFKLIWVV